MGTRSIYRGKRADPIYRTQTWKRLRRKALERDLYICQDCLKRPDVAGRCAIAPREATVVHHILPISEHPELALDLDNLISLCESCHNKRHPEKGGGGEKAREAPKGVRIIQV